MLTQGLRLASKDIMVLRREKNFMLIFGIFIFISAASAYIGWSSQHTITEVYRAAAAVLIASGKPVPAQPFSTNSLLIMKNMIIYIVLIGALLSVVIGHVITVSDRKAAVTRILFSRLSSSKVFLVGKVLAALLVLTAVLAASLMISVISLLVLHMLPWQAVTAVASFYMISFIYLSGYIFLGIFFSLTAKNSAQAVLFPVLIWTIITFAIPQISLALYPTGALNPVLPQTDALNSHTLTMIHNLIYPFSVSEHFKELGAAMLGLKIDAAPTNIAAYSPAGNLAVITIWSAVTILMSMLAVRKYKPEAGDNYE